MLLIAVVLVCVGLSAVQGQPGRCNQVPVGVTSPPRDATEAPFYLEIKTKIQTEQNASRKFLPDQTYVLVLRTEDSNRPFKQFMITVEDPAVDNNIHNFNHKAIDVGTLKTLDDDHKSQYSERCFSTVENKDMSEKEMIEMHWVSSKNPPKGQKVRFRAMVAENNEVWYTGGRLNITMEKEDSKSKDSPPLPVKECNVCSEARYEVVFKGMWSRGTHSLHYPNKPDANKYSHMVGASHSVQFTLWQQGTQASPGLKKLAEEADISELEKEIIERMSNGTRTLIRGKMHQHPHMSDPSHALFRVDREHHLFSLLVSMKPSPDWFLGTSMFELCDENRWYPYHEGPLYPWDAGTQNGVTYDSTPSLTSPVDMVERVAVGSFDKESPFYQMNLNDLNPFAMLEVRLLDEYPIRGVDCGSQESEEPEAADSSVEEKEANEEEAQEEPQVEESRSGNICPEGPGEWSPCLPDDGVCGLGMQTRTRLQKTTNHFRKFNPNLEARALTNCREEVETQDCIVPC